MTEALTLTRPLDGLRKAASRTRERAAKLWRAYPREVIGSAILALITGAAVAANLETAHYASKAPAVVAAAPASPTPLTVRNLAPDQALKVNAAIPVANGPNPAANPFKFAGNAAARKQALTCLASAVYYEAGNQDVDGERAVAQVVLNRVRHPAFPGSICGVVYEGSTRPTGCQFTFTCDGSLYRQPDAEGWKRAYKVAEDAISGFVFTPVGWATHYHADYVVPTWAPEMAKNAVVGAHLFYRWNGGWGQPAIFNKAYTGREPDALALRTAALSVVHVTPVTTQGLAAKIAEIPGAEAIKLQPSMRGDKRVAVRFNLVARQAADEAKHEEYTQKFESSDSLKWALSGSAVASNEQPLGTRAAAPPPAAATPAQGASTASSPQR
jgi:spore germination cell wall hydrolase CwlJ-like protein